MAAALRGQIKRLLAERIARQHQGAVAPVPKGDREHAAQAGKAIHAPLLIGMHDDLGVARRREAVAEAKELVSELDIIVDLAVIDGRNRSILIMDRLMPAVQIDDRKPPMADHHALILKDALIVRAAMAKGGAGRGKGLLIRQIAVRAVDPD